MGHRAVRRAPFGAQKFEIQDSKPRKILGIEEEKARAGLLFLRVYLIMKN
jgi:hypothetical protein